MRKESFILTLFLFIGCIHSSKMISLTALEQSIIQATVGDCTAAKNTLGLTYEKLAVKANAKLSGCLLKLYTDNDKITYSLNNVSQVIVQSQYFNLSLPTVVIIHGYLGSSESADMVLMAKEVKSLGNANVLSLDHSAMTTDIYYLASTYAQYVGEAFGIILADMYSHGARGFHMIGFSLGAHMAGYCGKQFNKMTDEKIDRITALDPAGPCYNRANSDQRLAKSDAHLVDVVHTDFGTIGISNTYGHLDFFPNGGSGMPGCWNKLCSHPRANGYYTESVKNKAGFVAVSCSDWDTFKNRGCTNNNRVTMGHWLPNDVLFGNYYLNTSGTIPYALGDSGVM